jgi:hypothetical protein
VWFSFIGIVLLSFCFGCSDASGLDPLGDEDLDGLVNGDEELMGTDPFSEDSDGDGMSDLEEVEAGTNPNYKYSHTYQADYNIGFCNVKPVPTGPTLEQKDSSIAPDFSWRSMQVGDVPQNLQFLDQNGEMVDLYSFCGTQVFLLAGAGW